MSPLELTERMWGLVSDVEPDLDHATVVGWDAELDARCAEADRPQRVGVHVEHPTQAAQVR